MHLSELLEAQRTQFGNWFTLWRKEAWRIEKDSFSGYVTRKPTCNIISFDPRKGTRVEYWVGDINSGVSDV